MKKKKSLLAIFLIPIMIIVVVEGMIPFFTLIFSGIRSSMENTVIDLDSHTVENRKVVLENDMLEHWSSISKESDSLESTLHTMLSLEGMNVEDFLGNAEIQRKYLEKVFRELVEVLQYDSTNGVFLVLGNEDPLEDAGYYQGFWVRDSDPQARTASYTDLQMERGNKRLAREMDISLDTSWKTNFELAGSGVRSADNFFYQPYEAAQKYVGTDTDMKNLGYWARPFVLEDYYMDNHRMITYSVPLVHDDTVFGVLGVEISIKYLMKYFPVTDLDKGGSAGAALVIDEGDGNYVGIAGEGALYDAVTRMGKQFSLSNPVQEDLRLVESAGIGEQKIYAVLKELNLYSRNVPYEDTGWALCGFVTEDSVYGLVTDVYTKILFTLVFTAVVSVFVVSLLIKSITDPVYRLVESVRGGAEGLHAFEESGIAEIDELHEVVRNLTDAQMEAEAQMLEEKERYRIAVKSSKDAFFTYRFKEKTLEMVNSKSLDGIWDCREHPEYIGDGTLHPADWGKVQAALQNAQDGLYVEFRVRRNEEYLWISLSGSVTLDEKGECSRIVGCIHNIHHRKMLEEEQYRKRMYDPVTTFYRLSAGLAAVENVYEKEQSGTLVLLEIQHFTNINEQYGLIFGDMILEQFAILLKKQFGASGLGDAIFIRAGADQVLIWLSCSDNRKIAAVLQRVQEKFRQLTDEKYLDLSMKGGIVPVGKKALLEDVLEQVKQTLTAARHGNKAICIYTKLRKWEKKGASEISFAEVASLERLKMLSLSSVALNLFDHGNEIAVVMDILSRKIQEEYGIEDIRITSFNREYMANSLFYCWKKKEAFHGADGIIRCSEAEYTRFLESCSWQVLETVASETRDVSPLIAHFAENKNDLVFHMLDNGQYAGSVIFCENTEILCDEKEEQKNLEEICTIIQNRINLQKHDLSAKAKSDFLARMSHEIRTPMNGIMGMTEIALKEGQTETQRIDCLKKIKSSSSYLLGLLNDILDMSKIESGKMKLIQEPFDLAQLLDGLPALLEAKIREKKICFETRIELDNHWFLGDALRLKQVLVNLLGNAIKYSNEGGTIRLLVKETGAQVYFGVEDNGIGIAEEKQQLIFRQFEQADDSEKNRKSGTGLGLAISSRLIRMMNSEIELDSKLGKGSRFYFQLKLQPLEDEQQEKKGEVRQPFFPGKRILVAEDNELNMEIICTILQDYGIETKGVENGQEAVLCMEKAAPGEFDMILMDIMMPVMNGLDATKAIRNIDREECRKIPIYAMSANAFDDDRRQSLASGMNGHLSKPVNIKALEETLHAVFDLTN